MINKDKWEKEKEVIQYVGDQVMSGKTKGQAIKMAMERYRILSHATIYRMIKHHIKS